MNSIRHFRPSTRALTASAFAGFSLSLAPSFAQLGGFTWKLTGCARTAGNTMSVDVCGPTCDEDSSSAVTTLPQSGVVDVDVDWKSKIEYGGVFQMYLTKHLTGEQEVVAILGSYTGGSWCAPSPGPCSGTTHFTFAVDALDTLRILAYDDYFCFSVPQHYVATHLHDWTFTPSALPTLTSVSPKSAWQNAPVRLTGSNLDSGISVSVDGEACQVLSTSPTSPTSALVDVPPGKPGYRDVRLSNSFGTKTYAHVLREWPVLTTKKQWGLQPAIGARIETSGAGSCVLAYSFHSLDSPLPVLPGTWYGLVLDPTSNLTPFTSAAIPASGAVDLSFPVSFDAYGMQLPLQAYVLSGTPPTASFTNLVIQTL